MELMLCHTVVTTESSTTPTTVVSMRTPIAELKGHALLWDCVTVSGDLTNKKHCIFCGHFFAGGPTRIDAHLDSSLTHVKTCIPGLIWKTRYNEVVAELKRRKQAVRQVIDDKSSREVARQISSPTIMNTFGKPTNEMVTEEWAKALVKKGLAIDLVDDPCFRSAITMTARAGTQYVDAQKGTCKLPHRNYMQTNVLPALDKKLITLVESKIEGLLQLTGAMIISDGWTSVQARAIVNALLATPAGIMFLEALDTSGNTKDARFIADFIIKIIETRGPANIVAVCMDGACTSSFKFINEKYPHVFCFICPAHSLDNFLKNVFSDKEKIKMKSIEGDWDWGSSIFLDPFTEAWDVIKFVSNHSMPHSIFRDIAKDPKTWVETPSFCELIRWGETRFASRLLMLQRYHSLRIVVESLVSNIEYKRWLGSQDVDKRKKGEQIRLTVQKFEHWEGVWRAVRVLNPVLTVLRLTDGKTGATLGKVWGLCAELDALYRTEIDGIDENIREMMHLLFRARWLYFHTNAFTAAKILDSEYIKDDLTEEDEDEFREALKKIAKTPGCKWDHNELLAQWMAMRTAVATQAHGFNVEEAFSPSACLMAPFEWARAYLYKWRGLQWAAMRLSALSCSASRCEHSWSIEGWIHSKKRNRLDQTNVERLVRMHTNLLLSGKLDEWSANSLPWEIELLIEEPETEE